MRSKKLGYSLAAAAGLLAAVFAGLSLKYSPDAVLMASALAADAVYVKLFVNTPAEDAGYIAEAVSKKDLRLCRKVSTRYVHSVMPRQTCYREVLKAVADPGICREAEVMDYIGEGQCYALLAAVTGDAALCERKAGDDSGPPDNCYYDMALTRNDPAFCRKVSDPRQREYCLEQCAAKKKYDDSRGSGPGPLRPG
ncbi:MAG: hypothetical protein AB1734_01685 [Elusimicrobiota bacterium]